jgi:SAM-dependent methyltransferase
MVADRFLTLWDLDYHPQFYALLKESMKNHWPLIDPTPLDRVLSQGQYPPESISLCSSSLEKLSGIPNRSVDIVVSNAVFEHLYDLKSAFSHLARITKSGGVGLHQVDFADHRDRSRPLEHLLLKEEVFYGKFKARLGEFGNRYRPQEMRQLLELVGFEVREFRPDIFTEEEYLTEFLGRLRQTRKSRYRDYPAEDLRFISGRFYVVKKPT